MFYAIGAFLMPVILVVNGLMLRKGESGKPDSRSGYRSGYAVKSDATWRFSRQYCGRLLFAIGLVGVPVAGVLWWLLRDSSWLRLVIGAILLVFLAAYPLTGRLTEKALRARFDEYGNPRAPQPPQKEE